MDGLSLIIPSRNEQYLEPTIKNVLENARGEIEVLVVLDGWTPDPQINIEDDRVKFIHFEESIGQRQAINYAAQHEATGKYMMKLDAHCAVDEGFDIKLAADCEYDWTVIPRMYNLDINTFLPKKHKRTDYMYMWVRPDGQFRAAYYNGKEYRRLHKIKKEIDDTMCCMGPCFYMHMDRFWELEGCDENHGGWGSQGIEVACKAWLSGGRLVVNKKTWFSHWFRGGSGPGFPYRIRGKQVGHARRYSKDLWLNNRWHLAKRDFQWMLDKFNPPGWEKEKKEKKTVDIYKPRNAKSHVHGTKMDVNLLAQGIEHYWDPKRRGRAKGFEDIVKFFKDLNGGKKFKTEKSLMAHPYYEYVKSGYKSTNKKYFFRIMRDSIELFNDIKKNGLKRPIEMWVAKGKYNISRGTRRLAILHVLGTKSVAVRIYKDKDYMEKLRFREGEAGPVTKTSEKQFTYWGWMASDKYWIHDYTPLYDRHIGHISEIDDAKILEIGVLRGGSLMLWQEAMPKAQIYGVDINFKPRKLPKSLERVTLLEGSQTDDKFNKEVVAPHGPFDLIVDDASHEPEHQIKGFDLLWDSVKPGGWYVVEDLYFRNYYRNKGTKNMMAKFSNLVDEMNEKCEIEAIHQYYNIVFIKKRGVCS